MLTVKHIHENGETTYPATRVIRIYKGGEHTKPGLIVVNGDDQCHLDAGEAYVMNAAGKTVDRYKIF